MPLLAPGVHSIATTKRDSAFLVDGDDGLTLVDVGWAGAPAAIVDALAERRLKPGDLKRIVITHAHPDHVQGADEMRRLSGAPILIHHADAPWLEHRHVPAAGRSGALGRFVDRLPKLHWEPFTADATVTDGELIDGSGLRVIHTPGHSPGHIALHHGSTGTVLVGDAVFNRGGLDLGRPAFAADPALRAAALARLPGDLRAIGFAHGADIDDAAGADAFTAFVRGLDRAAA